MAEETRYLIIGNSAGAVGAAEAIREVDKAGSVTIISDEPYPAYSRPLISEYLANSCPLERKLFRLASEYPAEKYPLERMLFRPPDFYQKNNIRALLGEKVVQLNCNEHLVEMEDGRALSWEKLLLATGGLPLVPRIQGVTLDGVFTFTTFDDARAIDEFLNQYPAKKIRAVVIGGGLIGVSVTEALVRRGVKVTMVEMKERILNTILDEEASASAERILEEAGGDIITGHTVSEVGSCLPGRVLGVSLDDNRLIPCQMVIIAIGVQPRTELTLNTGIKVNRGIAVDGYMATSVPGVYACGDVAEAYDFIYGENRVTPIWPNAYLGGRVAGFNMVGRPTEYVGGTAMNAMKHFDFDVVSAGIVTPPDGSYEVISSKQSNDYKKIVLKNGLVVGMVFAGDIEKSGIIFNLMKERVNVDGFKQALVTDDFGLVSIPDEMWRLRLEISPSELASSVVFVEQPEEILMGE